MNCKEYVYIMSNPSYDYLKIGKTRKDPLIRAKQLYTTGVPTPFVIEGIIHTFDSKTLETKIHNCIKKYRTNNDREFFHIDYTDLKKILTKELNLEITDYEITDYDISCTNILTNDSSRLSDIATTLGYVEDIDCYTELMTDIRKEMLKDWSKLLRSARVKTIVTTLLILIKEAATLFSNELLLKKFEFTKVTDIISEIKDAIESHKRYVRLILNSYEVHTYLDDHEYLKNWILRSQKKLDNLKINISKDDGNESIYPIRF